MDHEDLLFECAGINHIAWMTRLEVEGKDAYPLLFAAMEDPDVYAETRRKLLAGEDFSLERSVEYGSLIMHSLVTGEARAIYGNVENTGLVANLPTGCCVEVSILVDDTGLRPCHVGDLPPQCAATCAPHAAVQNLTVRAALEGNRDHVYHAAMLDRHAPSVLSLDEIAEMVDELIKAHGDAMPEGVWDPRAKVRR